MKFKQYFAFTILALALPAIQLSAQDGDIYFSFSGPAAPSNPIAPVFFSGETGSVEIYYSGTSDIDTGFSFDLVSFNGNVLFTDVEIFNEPAGANFLNRWLRTSLGTIADDAQTITGISTLNLPPLTQNPGIDISAAELDSGYDQATDSFLLATFEFEVIGDRFFNFAVFGFENTQVVNQGAALDVTFGTVIVTPEPSSGLLLGIGFGLQCGLRRRRRRI